MLKQLSCDAKAGIIEANQNELGIWHFSAEEAKELLFTNNETNNERLWGVPDTAPYVKDGINNYIVHGKKDAVNPEKKGTKASAFYLIDLKPGKSETIQLRLTRTAEKTREKGSGKDHASFFRT